MLVGLDQAVLVVDHQTVVVLARTEAEHNLHRMTLHETKIKQQTLKYTFWYVCDVRTQGTTLSCNC